MRKLLILLLGAILIGILSYFCFLNKAGGIKDDLVSKANSLFATKQMSWATPDIKGEDLKMTRIITLKGVAPSDDLKAEAERIVSMQDGVAGVENYLVVDKNKVVKVVTPKPQKIEPISQVSQVVDEVFPIEAEIIPLPAPVIESEWSEKEIVVEVEKEEPIKVVFSCQDEFEKILSSGKINFSYNKSTIKPDSYVLLDSLVEVINKCPKDAIEIGGHTDSDGSESYNKKLSTNRANAVKKYLVDKGISSKRVMAVGYGESNPIADNSTDEGKAINRRIEFNVIDIKDVKEVSIVEDEKNIEVASDLIEVNSIEDIPMAKTYELAREVDSVVPKVENSEVFFCQKRFVDLLSKDKIQFKYNKATIKPESYDFLDSLVDIAKECKNVIITIAGYTDADGSESFNKRLSSKRAGSVKDYLISKGVPSIILKSIGYGESNPIADNSTKDGKEKNRRIEFNVEGVK